jgi:hypothetical protein
MSLALSSAVVRPATSASAAPSPAAVTVGVGGAAPASATFTGGPITGTADASGSAAPVTCNAPACESIAITVAAPAGQPAKEIALNITVTFTAPAGNPSGLTGLDTWLIDSSGNTVGSAVSGSSPASIGASGLNTGTYTLEVSGEAAANGETYSGTVSARLPATTAPAPVGAGFTTGILPPAQGVGLTSSNEDAEPGMGVDGNGVFWVASDVEPFAAKDTRAQQALSGADVWKSTDDGRTWQWVAAPFNNTGSTPGLAGEDTDIAVAPVKNSNGFYNLYVASLWIGSTNVAVSQDGGQTWNTTPVNGEPVQDRPWLSADGACIFYLSYHALAPYDTVVDKYDTCNSANQALGSAVDPTETALFLGNIAPGLTNRFGKQVVDNSPASPHQHRIYVPMEGCATPTQSGLPEAGSGCATTPQVFVGVSDDGTTYTDHIVANVTTNKLFIWPDTVTTDSAGNVYLGWFDGQHAFVSVSKDGGTTWSPSVQVSAAPALSAVYPTVAASSPGHVEVAYYGSTRAGDADDATVMGAPNAFGSAPWQLYWATSSDFGKTWSQTTVTPIIHTGVLCYNGGGCGQYTGDRNLLDDFGVAISPTTGSTSIAFDNDQPDGVNGLTHTDFATRRAPTMSTPDLLSPGAAVLLLAMAGAAGVLRRRRKANVPARV